MEDRDTLTNLYYTMLLIRRTEEKILELLLQGKLASSMCHVSIGQEAVATGVCSAMQPQDYLTSTHRGHGHIIARGGDLRRIIAELLGRETGYCKGRGGSMHLVDVSLGHLGSNGIVGGHIGIATGAALWSSLQNDGRVTVAFFGEGAMTEGIFHEAANMAALWRLPIVFVCENNQYAMSLPWKHATAEHSFARKGEAYGMPGIEVDGQDVLAVRQVALQAIERARRGEGPTLIGAQTYRFLGHSRGDPSPYRDKEEEARQRTRDPIRIYQEHLFREGVLTQTDVEAIEAKVAEVIADAVRFAEESPSASLESVLEDVFA